MTPRTITLALLLVLLALLQAPVVAGHRWTPAFGTRGARPVVRDVVPRPAAAAAVRGGGSSPPPDDKEQESSTSDDQIAMKVACEQSDTFLAADAGCFDFF